MKKNIIYICLILLTLFFATNCTKTDTDGISRITYYPVLNYNGDHFMSIVVGSTYTEPGVTAKLDGKDYPVKTTGTVDGNTVGVYAIAYTSMNPDSFVKSDFRYIAVIDAGAAGADLSGTYQRSTNGAVATVTKVAPGVYLDTNVGGVAANNPAFILPVYFFNTTGKELVVPPQPTTSGTLSCSSSVIDAGGFEWIVVNPNFGTSLRVFVKQ